MNEQTLEIYNDAVYVITPMPQYNTSIGFTAKVELVMTKEIFQECYKKWILECEGDNGVGKI